MNDTILKELEQATEHLRDVSIRIGRSSQMIIWAVLLLIGWQIVTGFGQSADIREIRARQAEFAAWRDKQQALNLAVADTLRAIDDRLNDMAGEEKR